MHINRVTSIFLKSLEYIHFRMMNSGLTIKPKEVLAKQIINSLNLHMKPLHLAAQPTYSIISFPSSIIMSTVGIAGITSKFARLLVSHLLNCLNVSIRGYCRDLSKLTDLITSSPKSRPSKATPLTMQPSTPSSPVAISSSAATSATKNS